MTTEQLEEMLYFFYNDRKWYKHPEDINSHFEKRGFEKPELQAMVKKLTKDGYLIEEAIREKVYDGKTGLMKEVNTIHGWYISYDGIFLIDSLPEKFTGKPYQYLKDMDEKKKKRETIENLPKRFWWVIAILTFVIGFFGDIAKEALKQKISQSSEKFKQSTQTFSDSLVNNKNN
jgi:hypothetical protein